MFRLSLNLRCLVLLLCITFQGGAQNFTMKRKLKDVFNKGLIKAALSTGLFSLSINYS